MAILFEEPHSIQQKRAKVTRDVGSNAAEQDFVTAPDLDRTINGMFQTRSGDLVQDAEGNLITLDAILYTSEQDVRPDDQMIPSGLPGVTETFQVVSVEPKFDVDGEFTHMEVPLAREARR